MTGASTRSQIVARASKDACEPRSLRVWPQLARDARKRILLTEGSSLSARQAITTLGLAGHVIEICDPDVLCIGRFSRFVRRFHRCPGIGRDPEAYLKFLIELLGREKFDVLLPTHEQGYLLAKVQEQLVPLTTIALPTFESYVLAHGKASFSRLLTELNIPQPRTQIVDSSAELRRSAFFPAVVKSTIGTASRGVRFAHNSDDIERIAIEFERAGEFPGEVVLQELVQGALERAQSVFCHGRLVAAHAYRQIAEGVGGGDRIKESIHCPDVRSHLAQIGERLNWHGALSVDYVRDKSDAVPRYIDCNPRLVEPVNALLSGVDLAGLAVSLSMGDGLPEAPGSCAGVRTHMAMQGLMRCAVDGGARLDILREAWRLWRNRGDYAGSKEELTPVSVDPLSLVPLGYVALRALALPGTVARLARRSAQSHQLNPTAVKIIRDVI